MRVPFFATRERIERRGEREGSPSFQPLEKAARIFPRFGPEVFRKCFFFVFQKEAERQRSNSNFPTLGTGNLGFQIEFPNIGEVNQNPFVFIRVNSWLETSIRIGRGHRPRRVLFDFSPYR
jgi:hypothetical protein